MRWMTSEPAATIATAMSSAAWPAPLEKNVPMISGCMSQRNPVSAIGSPVRIQRAMRPCAVRELDEPPELAALADRLDDGVEHLGRVAARGALELCEERDLLEVAVGHAVGHLADGDLGGHAELVVLHDPSQLGAGRFRRVLDDTVERAAEAVADAERRGEHLERGRELVRELVAKRPELPPDDRVRRHRRRHESEQRQDERERREHDREHEGGSDRREHDLPCGPTEPCDLEVALEPSPPALRVAVLGHRLADDRALMLDERWSEPGGKVADPLDDVALGAAGEQEQRPAQQ